MPQANSTTSWPRAISPSASESTLPCSAVMSAASSSRRASSSSRNAKITWVRRVSEVRRPALRGGARGSDHLRRVRLVGQRHPAGHPAGRRVGHLARAVARTRPPGTVHPVRDRRLVHTGILRLVGVTDSAIQVVTVADGVARISWDPRLTAADWRLAIDAVRRDVEKALVEHARVEAHVAVDDQDALRLATWAGMRREGVMRGVESDLVCSPGCGPTLRCTSRAGSGRCSTRSCRASGRSARCWCATTTTGCCSASLTYKQDWDLPGGVVEVGESPQLAVSREVAEELGLDDPRGPAAAHRLAAAVGRMGRRALPGLRRRGPRRGDHRHDRARGPGDPGCRVLHGRPGRASGAPTSPPAGSRPRSRLLQTTPGRRTPRAAARPVTSVDSSRSRARPVDAGHGGRHHQDRAERDQEAQLGGEPKPSSTAMVAA